MAAIRAYTNKTELYQKVKKPLLERQRRARINKCLDSLKQMIADFQHDETILRMDKAEMLEATISYMRSKRTSEACQSAAVHVDSFKHGYMNAVNEVSRVLASTPGVNIEMGKTVMTHLGRVYNRLQKQQQEQQEHQMDEALSIDCSAPASPASSGYHSDYESPAASPATSEVWRPW